MKKEEWNKIWPQITYLFLKYFNIKLVFYTEKKYTEKITFR